MRIFGGRIACAVGLVVAPSLCHATVFFQNVGTPTGWSNYPQQPAHGTLTQVSSPVYKGTEAIRFYQKFEGFGSYHDEVVQSPVAPTGSDTYFGLALYLPSNWVYHNQSLCFTQWARSDSSNTPWTLMCVQMDYIFTGGSGGLHHTWATGITVGEWHHIVVRIKNSSTNGILEVWVDGINRGQLTGNVSPGGPSIRWSSGQYATYWRANEPLYDPYITYMDHFRVASTYAEAEPANWGGGPTPTPTASPTPTPTATPTPTPTPTPTATPTPTPTPRPTYVEITPGAAGVSASTSDSNVPANSVDNSLATRWSGNGDGAWLQLDVGTLRAVGYVRIATYNGNTRRSRFDLQYSPGDGTWANVLTGAQTSGTTTAEETFDFTDVNARLLRYVGHGNTDPAKATWNSVTEISVWGR